MRGWQVWAFSALVVGIGSLVLTERLAAGEKGKELLKVTGKLSADDPKDKLTKHGFKSHTLKMEKGQGYKIDLRSDDFDSFLRLENPEGLQVAFDDDSGGFPHARITYLSPRDGEFKIIVTSFDGKAGDYTLTVTAASKDELIETRAGQLDKLSAKEKKEVLADLKKLYAHKELGQKQFQVVFGFATKLEKSDPKLAGEVYQDFGKLFAKGDAKAAKFGAMFEGAARRVKLFGNPIEVKGTLLDGKAFDWSSYKGKVVLVDFWATWCGPCVAEVPNIKKMYAAYHEKGFEVVGISLDSKEETPKQFMKNKELQWSCIFDGKGPDAMANYYGIFYIPQAILVDREGKVVSLNARGPELGKQLEKLLGPLEKDKK